MSPKQNTRDLTLDEQNYQLVEYGDYFVNQKNKKVSSRNLGKKFAAINAHFFEYLKGYNIPCAYVKKSDSNRLLFVRFTKFSFKVKILNAADKRIAKLFSVKQGSLLELPVFEYHFGDSKESLITESHLISFDLCTYEEMKFISRLCSKINAIIKSFFERRNETLIELTCGFGKFESKIFLIDDLSPLSLKIISNETNGNLPDPYKIETPAQMKKYTDHLLQITNGA